MQNCYNSYLEKGNFRFGNRRTSSMKNSPLQSPKDQSQGVAGLLNKLKLTVGGGAAAATIGGNKQLLGGNLLKL